MTEISIPLPLVALILFALAVIGIAQLPLSRFTGKRPPLEALQQAFGLERLNGGVFLLLALLWLTVFALLFAGLLHLIWTIVFGPHPTEDTLWDWRFALAKLTALTGVLGAVVALPFTLIRLTLNIKLRDHNEEVLYNEKMNTAVADLYAQRQVTRWTKDGNAENGWEDDVPRRNGAIDRLKGLTDENPDLRPRVDRLLTVYLRELSKEFPPQEPPEDVSPEGLEEWVANLPDLRSDMENAAQTLSRLNRPEDVRKGERLPDLKGMNLQKANLSQLFLENANLSGSQLQGAKLFGGQFRDADLGTTQFQGARLYEAQLQRASLFGAELQGANLIRAQLQEADLFRAKLQRANLTRAQLQRAKLFRAQLQDADLSKAQFQGADLSGAGLQRANLNKTQLQDASLSMAELQGASLYDAQLQRVILFEAKFDANTNLSAANFRGAAVRFVDFTQVPQIAEHLATLFGDITVKLPEGVQAPDHFKIEYEDWDAFETAWRKFQRSIGQDPDNPE